eukprot:scaffold6506_cov171-Amphora_coffeaeformis.AAC.21
MMQAIENAKIIMPVSYEILNYNQGNMAINKTHSPEQLRACFCVGYPVRGLVPQYGCPLSLPHGHPSVGQLDSTLCASSTPPCRLKPMWLLEQPSLGGVGASSTGEVPLGLLLPGCCVVDPEEHQETPLILKSVPWTLPFLCPQGGQGFFFKILGQSGEALCRLLKDQIDDPNGAGYVRKTLAQRLPLLSTRRGSLIIKASWPTLSSFSNDKVCLPKEGVGVGVTSPRGPLYPQYPAHLYWEV